MIEKKIVLFGAGSVGLDALYFFGIKNVAFFVDNKNAGRSFKNLPIRSVNYLLEVYKDYTVIVSVGEKYAEEIIGQLSALKIPAKLYTDIRNDWEQNLPAASFPYASLSAFRDKYKGETCFLIGTSPSLNIGDLETIFKNKAFSFCCNSIPLVFDKTNFRPDFYCAVDVARVIRNIDFIINYPITAKFISDYSDNNIFPEARLETIPSDVYLLTRTEVLDFSLDPAKLVVDHNTVMIDMLHLAFYMGFKKIYLLGVDMTFSAPDNDTAIWSEHFYGEDELGNEILEKTIPYRQLTTVDYFTNRLNTGYTAARDYAQNNGIEIFNATRGGKLEVFTRVDFDSIF